MDLLPGDVGFARIGGRVGALVNIGQAIIGDSCRYSHAWIAVDRGTVLEAMPGGARIRPYVDDGPVYRLPLEGETCAQIALYGPHHVGAPYGFSDYLALALHHLAPESAITSRVRAYVSSSGRMICSQLVDHVLCKAGYHLFDDGRLAQDVTPGDLWYACVDQGKRVR